MNTAGISGEADSEQPSTLLPPGQPGAALDPTTTQNYEGVPARGV